MNISATTPLTIVYDGMCHLCSGSMRWIAKRADAHHVIFVPVQSAQGAVALQAVGLDASNPASFLVMTGGDTLQKSAAVIAILDRIGGGWKLVGGLLKLFPAPFLNKMYDWVAANRYKWFGRRETCSIIRDGENES